MKAFRSYGAADDAAALLEENVNAVTARDEEDVVDLDKNILNGKLTLQGRLRLLILISFVAFFATVLYSSKKSGNSGQMSSFFVAKNNVDSLLTAVVTNEYSSRNLDMFPYPFLQDSLLMEPFRTSTVSVSGVTCPLTWSLVGTGLISSESFSGSADSSGIFTVEPHETGKYSLTVTEDCNDNTGKTLTQTVWVKYVRRELQSLNDQDREEFLDAFHTLWEVSTTDGIEKYGENYRSLFYLASVHNDAGGNSVCDEFHAGSGFVGSHMFLGAFLEQSLRLVNPRVSLHYMEYSKYFSSDDFQNHLDNQLDGGSWTEILSSKYFGSNDPITGEIVDGRWASSPVPYLTDEFFEKEKIPTDFEWFPDEAEEWATMNPVHITSPYGLLRSPWNYNPSPYTVRYNNVNQMQATGISNTQMSMYKGSNCDDYETFIKSFAVGQPLENYLYESEDNVHGKIHFTFGGAGGEYCKTVDDQLRSTYGFTDDNIMAIARAAQVFFKTFVPLKCVDDLGYEYPLSCSTDPWQNGQLTMTSSPGSADGPACSCSSSYFESEESLDDLITLWKIKDNEFLYTLDFDQRKDAMQLVCGRMAFDGDMAGSGAATDPLFWVAHGAVERLFQRVAFEGVLKDKTYVNPQRNQCSGHVETGTKKWLKGYFLEDPTVDVTTLTNVDLVEMLDPSSDKYRDLMDFVYEDANWSWCEGFDSWFDVTTPTTTTTKESNNKKMTSPAKKATKQAK